MPEYISREALKQALTDKSRIGASRVPTWNDAFDAVTNIPAADVVEERHAHWIVKDGCAYCSDCRNNFKKAIMTHSKFCPMCGAKMDGGQDDV